MDIGRRQFMGGAAALSLLPTLPAYAAGRDRSYGMIQISASGMTVEVYKFDLEKVAAIRGLSGFQRMVPKRSGDPTSIVASPLEPGVDEATAAKNTIDIVERNIQNLRGKFGVEDKNIAIVASSGVASYSSALIDRLQAELKSRTGHEMDVVSALDEARLAFDWIVPAKRRDKVLQVDIGSGNTKGGFYPDRRKARFEGFDFPYGTKTMAGAVKKRWPATRTFDFGQRSAEFYADTLAPLLARQLERAPLAMERPHLCLTGGVVWATAAILKPAEMADGGQWIEFRPDDFARLLKLIENGTPYGSGLPETLSDRQREKAVKTLGAIRNVFNPHQLAAGAAIGDGLSRQLAFDKRQSVLFATFANNSWSSQYLIEKFG